LIVVLAVTQKCSHSFFFQDKKKSLFHLTDLASTTLTSWKPLDVETYRKSHMERSLERCSSVLNYARD
jgi:hypothetical protein